MLIHTRSSRTLYAFLIAAASMTGLSGCSTSNLASIPVTQANLGLDRGYQVDSGDKLRVNVFDEDSLTGEYEVGVGGELSLPLIEPINAKGMTPDAISQVVAEKLAAGGYVLYPKVSVEIVEHRPFFILGEVNTPGEYAYSGELTLEQAVAKAGGFTPRANKNSVVLRRQSWTESKRIRLNGAPLKIAPGDTIRIQEAVF